MSDDLQAVLPPEYKNNLLISLDHFIYNIFALFKGLFIILLGPLNYQLQYLLIVMIIDLYIGIRAAYSQKNFKIKYCFGRTLEKFIIYTILIIVSHSLDVVIKLPGTTRWVCIIILLGYEAISVLNNTGKMGYSGISNTLKKYITSTLGKVVPVDVAEKEELKEDRKDE